MSEEMLIALGMSGQNVMTEKQLVFAACSDRELNFISFFRSTLRPSVAARWTGWYAGATRKHIRQYGEEKNLDSSKNPFFKSSIIYASSLNEESILRGGTDDTDLDKFSRARLSMEYWGPCKEAPAIVSPPKDSYGPLGANLTLDCEARGYPAPVITWQFVSAKGETKWLPSKKST
jgi:hypothetical protein